MKKTGRILIIDDNRELLSALKLCLTPYLESVELLYDPNRLISLLGEKQFDLILLDMNFSPGKTSGNEGIYWLGRIKEADPSVGIVLITAYGDVSLAVKSLREGALDFILKSWDEGKIVSTVLAALKLQESHKQIKSLKEKERELKSDIDKRNKLCYGKSAEMQKIKQLAEKVAVTEANVLILGENGTGKEVMAREIHRLSLRSDDIFVKIDLGTISESLFESELFGHKKGAFTGANIEKKGRLEVASGGSVFLDEIGNLSPDMQTKLLSLIQNREIVRVGDTRAIPVDVRIICATNKDLYRAVEEREFREDLFYRLNTIVINMPSLRDRKEDIPDLTEIFLEEINSDYNRKNVLSDKAMNFIVNYDWPGNIRELRHMIEKGVILAENQTIKLSDLQSRSARQSPAELESFRLDIVEKRTIVNALDKFDWNISRTSKELGINRSTLYEKISKYEISKN